MKLRAERQRIGSVGFLLSEGWPGNELSWLLTRDVWGQGCANEAASAARSFGRVALGAGELISRVREQVVRSTKLTAMLGAVNGRAMDFLGGKAPSS